MVGEARRLAGVSAAPIREIQVEVVRVFCDEHGDHGNPLGVVIDGAACADPAERQEIAFELGFSETVFVDDAATGELRIYTPAAELPLAGHPLVGTSWLLARRGAAIAALRPPAGTVPTSATNVGASIDAQPAWAPAFDFLQHDTPGEIDDLDASIYADDQKIYAWAWIDEAAGLIRARSFPLAVGVREDEATGSAALALAGFLRRPIQIRQGRGSVIEAAPQADGTVRVEGRVVYDESLRLRR